MTGSRVRTAAGLAAALVVGVLAGSALDGEGGGGATPAARVAVPTTTAAEPERSEVVVAAQPAGVPAEVRRGSVATVEFQARPGSSCQVELQAGSGDGTQRLPARVAGEDGRVSWRWTVSDDIPAGPASAVVVCSGGARADVPMRVV